LSRVGRGERNVGEATGPRGPNERERVSQLPLTHPKTFSRIIRTYPHKSKQIQTKVNISAKVLGAPASRRSAFKGRARHSVRAAPGLNFRLETHNPDHPCQRTTLDPDSRRHRTPRSTLDLGHRTLDSPAPSRPRLCTLDISSRRSAAKADGLAHPPDFGPWTLDIGLISSHTQPLPRSHGIVMRRWR
jgi:hypothetical protein